VTEKALVAETATVPPLAEVAGREEMLTGVGGAGGGGVVAQDIKVDGGVGEDGEGVVDGQGRRAGGEVAAGGVEVFEDACFNAGAEAHVNIGEAAGAEVAVGHDGGVEGEGAVSVAAAVDGGCVAVVGVPGAEVVAEFVGDDHEVPVVVGVVLDGEGEEASEVGRDAVGVVEIAGGVEVGNTAAESAAGEAVGDLAGDVGHGEVPVVLHLEEEVGGAAGADIGVVVGGEDADIGEEEADIDITLVDAAGGGEQGDGVGRGEGGVAAVELGELVVGIDGDTGDAAGRGAAGRGHGFVTDDLGEAVLGVEGGVSDDDGAGLVGVTQDHVGGEFVGEAVAGGAGGDDADAFGGADEAVDAAVHVGEEGERVRVAGDGALEEDETGEVDGGLGAIGLHGDNGRAGSHGGEAGQFEGLEALVDREGDAGGLAHGQACERGEVGRDPGGPGGGGACRGGEGRGGQAGHGQGAGGHGAASHRGAPLSDSRLSPVKLPP
jgi:hypothetical protein